MLAHGNALEGEAAKQYSNNAKVRPTRTPAHATPSRLEFVHKRA